MAIITMLKLKLTVLAHLKLFLYNFICTANLKTQNYKVLHGINKSQMLKIRIHVPAYRHTISCRVTDSFINRCKLWPKARGKD